MHSVLCGLEHRELSSDVKKDERFDASVQAYSLGGDRQATRTTYTGYRLYLVFIGFFQLVVCASGERWLREHPEASAKLMDLLSGVIVDYLAAQVCACVQCSAV